MDADRRKRRSLSRPLKIILIILGLLFTGIGLIGIFVPILPTTPFLLLAAACFLRSSDRLYNWLLNNRIFGRYLRNYIEKKGIPIGVKIFTISLLWITILISAFIFIDIIWVRILLIIIAIGVTIHLLMIMTYRDPPEVN
ncbi:MAG: YbaN family protein [Thermoplasmatota archaeon]